MEGLLHFRVTPVLAVAFAEAFVGGCVLAGLSALLPVCPALPYHVASSAGGNTLTFLASNLAQVEATAQERDEIQGKAN